MRFQTKKRKEGKIERTTSLPLEEKKKGSSSRLRTEGKGESLSCAGRGKKKRHKLRPSFPTQAHGEKEEKAACPVVVLEGGEERKKEQRAYTLIQKKGGGEAGAAFQSVGKTKGGKGPRPRRGSLRIFGGRGLIAHENPRKGGGERKGGRFV